MYRTEDDPENDQVDGNHYKNFAIQRFLEGEIIKRLVCWRHPTLNRITELVQARHEIELLIKFAKEDQEQTEEGDDHVQD